GGAPLPQGERFFAPTVLADVRPDALLCREETFGPVAGLVRFTSEAEVVALANDSRAGLASYAYTRDAARQWRLMES
ncbi:aldehyde dehydrogenase family protein, partial [Salmonella enterica]|uniref:aldehyde dehydrogenase family protein n=1 Tax=Salmonella enterica TaxID=28901 RepID=UPI0032B35BED